MYNRTGEEIRQYKYCGLCWGKDYENNKEIKMAFEKNRDIKRGGGEG